MNVVVDSSVVVAALLDTGDDGLWAEQLLEQGPLYVPDLLRVEVANVLRRLDRTGRITGQEANAAYADLNQLNMEFYSYEPFSERIWELRHNVTCYDAWYVALAEALELPLATLDVRLVRANGPKCRFIIRGAGR